MTSPDKAQHHTAPHDPLEPLRSEAQLVEHFVRGCKQPAQRRIGLEHEKIGFLMGTPADPHAILPVPYRMEQDGRVRGVRGLFDGLCRYGWEPVTDGGIDGAVIALYQKNHGTVTLEPGGQFEYSAPPLHTDDEILADFDAHFADVLAVAAQQEITFVGCGFRPLGTWDDVGWMPKQRYRIMRDYLPTRGALGVEMMKRTATVQANLDYTSEADAMQSLRLSLLIGPLVTAIYAASPLKDGRPAGMQSVRAGCWLDTDPDRCGLLPFAFRPQAGFADYAQWALDVPLFFLKRDGVYHAMRGVTFRRFLHEGHAGLQATLHDWELHLSTLFPDARLKQYLEVRTADAGPLSYARALAPLWRGLLYSDGARIALEDLFRAVSYDDLRALHAVVPTQGLAATFKQRSLTDWCQALLQIAHDGLVEVGSSSGQAALAPLREAVAAGHCPAHDILAAFHQSNGDHRRFVEAIRLR